MKIRLKKSKKKKTESDLTPGWEEFDEEGFPGISIKVPKNFPVKKYSYCWPGRGFGFLPILLLIIAVFWLLRNLGYLSESLFLPVLLIVIAVYFILRRFTRF